MVLKNEKQRQGKKRRNETWMAASTEKGSNFYQTQIKSDGKPGKKIQPIFFSQILDPKLEKKKKESKTNSPNKYSETKKKWN